MTSWGHKHVNFTVSRTLKYGYQYDFLPKVISYNKKRINIVHDFSKADYIIDSYMKRIRGNFSINQEEYAKYYDIKINKSSINTVYKKNRIN